jgi:threonine/homoserine/homoserine lactone efflux protein
MTYEILTGLVLFALVSSITPGPNNLMLMASGANFGFQRTIPHMLGVGLGFTFMVLMVGIGLVRLFDLFPITHTLLKVAGVTYLLWLAFKIATAASPEHVNHEGGRPMTFMQAALFQWVNPKAWTMAVTAVTIYAPSRSLEAAALVAMVFGAVNLPSVSLWIVLGQQARRLLTNPTRLVAFNVLMALLLVGSLYPVLWPQSVS